MSWSKSFTAVLSKDLVTLAREAGAQFQGSYAERERLQILVAAELAVLTAAHMGATLAKLNVTLSGHANGEQPGRGDTLSVSVNNAGEDLPTAKPGELEAASPPEPDETDEPEPA